MVRAVIFPKHVSNENGHMNADLETPRRRLSGALVRLAAGVMPSSLQHWADAMRNELAYMTDDREALRSYRC